MTGLGPQEVMQRFNVSRESQPLLELYVETLLKWQDRLNLIGSSTVQPVWQRHIADSLQLLQYIPPGSRTFADLGSGAGIPGIVIALATGLRGHLYESNGKKVAFLREVIRKTGASVAVHQTRIESLSETADLPDVQFVLARAFAPLPQLMDYAAPFLAQGAIGLFHKGQDVDAELTAATKCWKMKFNKHPSLNDSTGVILEVKEATRVKPSAK